MMQNTGATLTPAELLGGLLHLLTLPLSGLQTYESSLPPHLKTLNSEYVL